MKTAFIEELQELVSLDPIEALILEVSGVSSYESLFDLVTSFPSLAEAGIDLSKLSSVAAPRTPFAAVAASEDIIAVPMYPVAGAEYPEDAPSPPGTEIPVPKLRPMLRSQMFGATGPTFQSSTASSQAIPVNGGAIQLATGNWPVHNQGQRGTCVAFAVAACRQHSLQSSRLSEQYLYWATKRQTADPHPNTDGTYLLHAQNALNAKGICDSSLWAYNPMPNQADITHEVVPTAPSAIAHADAFSKKHNALLPAILPGHGAVALWDALNQSKHPVAISLPVFTAPGSMYHNWNTPLARAKGAVSDPFPTSVCVSGHAVCVTGFVPDPNEPHGGYFVFRNSWGSGWGAGLPDAGYHGPEQGYGQVSATYVAKHLWELLSM